MRLADVLRVPEVDAPLGPQDQQAREGLVVRVLGGARPEDVRAPLAPHDVDRRVVRHAEQAEHRQDDGGEDALQRAEQHHPDAGDERPAELLRPVAADLAEARRADEADRGGDHDAGERRMRDAGPPPAPGTGASRARHPRSRGPRPACALPPSRFDRRLRGAAAAGHRAEQAAQQVGRAGRDELLVRVGPGLAGRGERAPGRDRLREAHERDRHGRGPERLDERQLRADERRAGRPGCARPPRRPTPAGRGSRPPRCRRRPRAAARAAAGPGARGRSTTASVAKPTASVVIEVSGRWRTSEPASRTHPSLS